MTLEKWGHYPKYGHVDSFLKGTLFGVGFKGEGKEHATFFESLDFGMHARYGGLVPREAPGFRILQLVQLGGFLIPTCKGNPWCRPWQMQVVGPFGFFGGGSFFGELRHEICSRLGVQWQLFMGGRYRKRKLQKDSCVCVCAGLYDPCSAGQLRRSRNQLLISRSFFELSEQPGRPAIRDLSPVWAWLFQLLSGLVPFVFWVAS